MIGKRVWVDNISTATESNGSVQDTDRKADPFTSFAYYCGYHLFYVQDQVTVPENGCTV